MQIDFASGSCRFPLGTCEGWSEVCGEVSAPWTVTSSAGGTNVCQYLLSQLMVVVQYFMQVSHLPESDLTALWSWVKESSKLCTNILSSLSITAAAALFKERSLQALVFFTVQDICQKYNSTMFEFHLFILRYDRLSLLSLWRCTLLWRPFDSYFSLSNNCP